MTDDQGLFGDFRSHPFDTGEPLEVARFYDAINDDPYCVELPNAWLQIISGLLDVFRSARYLAGTQDEIENFQWQAQIVQEILALAESCGGLDMVTCEELEACLATSPTIAQLNASLAEVRKAMEYTYAGTKTVLERVETVIKYADTNQTDYATVSVWQHAQTIADDPLGELVIPLSAGADAVQIVLRGNASQTGNADFFMFFNEDTNEANYRNAQVATNDFASAARAGIHSGLGDNNNHGAVITIYNYDVPGQIRNADIVSMSHAFGEDETIIKHAMLTWRSSAPITSIDLVADGGGWNSVTADVYYLRDVKVAAAAAYDPAPVLPDTPYVATRVEVDFSEPLPNETYTIQIGERGDVFGNPSPSVYRSVQYSQVSAQVNVIRLPDTPIVSVSADAYHETTSTNTATVTRVAYLYIYDATGTLIYNAPFINNIPLNQWTTVSWDIPELPETADRLRVAISTHDTTGTGNTQTAAVDNIVIKGVGDG